MKESQTQIPTDTEWFPDDAGRPPQTNKNVTTPNWTSLWRCPTCTQLSLSSGTNRLTVFGRRIRRSTEIRHHWTHHNLVGNPNYLSTGKRRFNQVLHGIPTSENHDRQIIYLVPRMEVSIDSQREARICSTLEVGSGYWLVEIDESDHEKTLSTGHCGLH